MNSKERVIAAIKGEQVDRLPMGFWHHFPAETFASVDATVECHKAYFEASQCDIFKVMNENIFPFDFKIEKTSDWRKLRTVTRKDDFIQKQVEATKRIVDMVDGRAFVVMTLHGIIASAWHARGGSDGYSEGSLLLQSYLRDDPESFAEGFKKIADAMCILADEVKGTGIDGIYYSALGAETYLFNDEEHATYVKPYDKQILEAAAKLYDYNFLHICKDKLNLARYSDLPAAVINWGESQDNDSLTEGWKHFPHMALMGGFDNTKGPLLTGSVEEIKAHLASVIEKTGRKRFLVGADCTLPEGVDNAQYGKVKAALEQLG